MSSGDEEELQTDLPLEDIDEDQLGYANFASHLSDVLTSRVPSDGYTIGIYGEWGSGKSTILNFTEQLLQEAEESPIVVRFNPWWFSGQADLTEKFLAQLGAELGDESAFPEVRANLAKLSSTLSHVPFQSFTGLPLGQAFAAANSVLQQEEESVENLKESISEVLKESDRRIIVIVDDIDRLAPKEIAQMLQVIKSVGDFPNVSYVLAFDPAIVSPAIERVQSIEEGREYLRKIVHLPLSIPMQKQNSLRSLFIQRLAKIQGNFIFDTDRGRDLLDNGVMPVLDTPRNVTRLGNTIDVMYTALGNEVNFVDLVGLETLRVFRDDIYEEVRSTPDRFAGQRISLTHRTDDPDDYSDLFSDDDIQTQREAVESILKVLFPKVRNNLMNSYGTGRNWNEKRVERRICHKDRFPVYFRLAISEGDIPISEVGATISLVGNSEEFTTEIEEMLTESNPQHGTKASAFMSHLNDRIDGISPDDAYSVVQSILSIGDRLIKESNSAPAFYPREAHYLARTIEKLLQKREDSDPINELTNAISDGGSPYLSYVIVRRLLSEHEEYGHEENTTQEPMFELEQLEQLKPILVQEIAEAAENGELLEMPSIVRPLSWWNKWGDSTTAEEWVEELTEDDDGLITFIDAMSKTTVLGGDTPASYLDPRWIDDYFDRDDIRGRIDAIDQDDLQENQISVIERFDEGEDILNQNLDAGSVEVWFLTRRS